MGIIYCLTFPNNKKYIGQTIQPLEQRLKQHHRSNDCTALYNAINKYKSYNIEVLLEINNELLDFYEIKFINLYNTICPYGYNIRDGGSRGKFCEITKIKMSNSRKGKTHLPETIEKIKNSNIGKVLSETTKGLISESKKKSVLTEDSKKKMSRLGMKHTDETKKLISLMNIGKIVTDNTKEKVSLSLRRNGTELNLPKYLLKIEKGYLVRVPGYKSKTFTRLANEDNLQSAIDFLNNIMNNVQRLNSNGELN